MSQPAKRPHTWLQLYLHGLSVSVCGNAQAFGFSILITVSYGIVSAASPTPSPGDLIGFALSGVAAFSLMNLAVAWLKNIKAENIEATEVVLIATASDFLAVATGLGAAFAAVALFDGLARWIFAPFAAGLSYGLVQALEIAVTRHDTGKDD